MCGTMLTCIHLYSPHLCCYLHLSLLPLPSLLFSLAPSLSPSLNPSSLTFLRTDWTISLGQWASPSFIRESSPFLKAALIHTVVCLYVINATIVATCSAWGTVSHYIPSLLSFHNAYHFAHALPSAVSIIDTGKCLFVWTGGKASPKEKRNSLPYAHVNMHGNLYAAPLFLSFLVFLLSSLFPPPPQNYLMKTKHPLVPVSCYVQGRESREFWKAVA